MQESALHLYFTQIMIVIQKGVYELLLLVVTAVLVPRQIMTKVAPVQYNECCGMAKAGGARQTIWHSTAQHRAALNTPSVLVPLPWPPLSACRERRRWKALYMLVSSSHELLCRTVYNRHEQRFAYMSLYDTIFSLRRGSMYAVGALPLLLRLSRLQ